MLERRRAERRRSLPLRDQELIGHFCRIPDGQRVYVESVRFAQGGLLTRAVYQYFEGPNKGQIGNCLSSSLELLGKVIPVQQDTGI
jgi:hypothetical protein